MIEALVLEAIAAGEPLPFSSVSARTSVHNTHIPSFQFLFVLHFCFLSFLTFVCWLISSFFLTPLVWYREMTDGPMTISFWPLWESRWRSVCWLVSGQTPLLALADDIHPVRPLFYQGMSMTFTQTNTTKSSWKEKQVQEKETLSELQFIEAVLCISKHYIFSHAGTNIQCNGGENVINLPIGFRSLIPIGSLTMMVKMTNNLSILNIINIPNEEHFAGLTFDIDIGSAGVVRDMLGVSTAVGACVVGIQVFDYQSAAMRVAPGLTLFLPHPLWWDRSLGIGKFPMKLSRAPERRQRLTVRDGASCQYPI